jgi:uncharacterized protein (UPF0333 family)
MRTQLSLRLKIFLIALVTISSIVLYVSTSSYVNLSHQSDRLEIQILDSAATAEFEF